MRSKNQPTRTQQARRQDILEATIHLVATQGYAATATSAIAEAANTSKGTVLYHFGSKQALDAAVVDALFRAGRDAMGTSMAAASTRDRPFTPTWSPTSASSRTTWNT
jgi:AcrR family transcriptional regulator